MHSPPKTDPRLLRHSVLPCAFALALAALPAWAADSSTAKPDRKNATDVRASAPITQFNLPLFNDEGQRLSLLVAAEARVLTPNHVSVSDMTLTRYNMDEANTIDTTITSPFAEAFIREQVVKGDRDVRIVRTDFQATGADWSYSHKDQRITIGRDVHIVFKSEIQNILK